VKSKTTTKPSWYARIQSLAPVPLRLVLGFGFLVHGYPKLFTAEGNEGFVEMLGGIGVPAPGLGAYLVGAFEFFGGILLILGVGVRVIAALGAVEMLVAAVLVHGSAGFDFMNVIGTTDSGAPEFGLPGYEVNLLYMAAFLTLLITGAGTLSLPAVRRPEAPRARAAPEPRTEEREEVPTPR
jgi:putative oxidoreductase